VARRERGAAAVEMAIVLPLLLLVFGGIVDFGRAFYANVVITNAAREGARMVAMGYSNGEAATRVTQAVGNLGTLTATSAFTGCPSGTGATATVTITNFDWLVLNVIPSFFGGSVPEPTLTATGNMRCSG
jgi:Flp pilus assembly protein TadG